ncbi:MAG: peptidyl-tRNA hydrolase Pth2 [Candidatus Jordarchaeum sp.]|uniref:peptidyl-tRNA hydrolase Pth2 n=1 Tax=Candidatus Jordarchaeum sp. TaxID=2823881 RepID=UPI00404A95CA
MFEYKMVILVRSDIKMSKGKMAAQVAHAAVSASEEARKKNSDWWKAWMGEGQKKAVVKINSLEELKKYEYQAIKQKIPHALITDRGLTEVPPGTVTALAIGPGPEPVIDSITGGLTLL